MAIQSMVPGLKFRYNTGNLIILKPLMISKILKGTKASTSDMVKKRIKLVKIFGHQGKTSKEHVMASMKFEPCPCMVHVTRLQYENSVKWATKVLPVL